MIGPVHVGIIGLKGIVKNEETAAKHVARRALCANINISPLTMSQTAHSGKFSIPDHKRLLETFGCLQAERTIAIRKRKFSNKVSVLRNALCRVFVAIAKTELESCCTEV